MPSLKAIRTRIAAVKNTQKITKAMKLVAAARLRKAQDAMTAARPYAKRLDVKSLRVVVVGSERGLAGGYNSNLNRSVERFMVDEKPNYPHIEIATLGRK